MKPDIENTNPDRYSTIPHRPKAREVSSRFLSPSSSSVAALIAAHEELSGLKPRSSAATTLMAAYTKNQNHNQNQSGTHTDGASMLACRPWPSTTSPKPDSLAAQIRKEQQDDEVAEKLGSLSRQKSCTEFSRFEKENPLSSKISQEDHISHKGVFGGSMRYTGKLFSKKSSPVDENALRRRSLMGKSEPEISGNSSNSPQERPKKSGKEAPVRSMSFERSPKGKKSPKLKRASSMMTVFGSTTSKWAMSPGRSSSPPMTVENKGVLPMSFSSMKPPTSPSKKSSSKGVGSLLSKGLDIIKGKGRNGNYFPSVSSSPLGPGVVDGVHKLRINHNRLVQWRYANAKTNAVNEKIVDNAERDLMAAYYRVTKIRHSVVQKRIQLEKEKLQMKLYHVVRSQIESLKAWGNSEREHITAVSTTKDSLYSVICRVPLLDGAKMDPHLTSIALRRASDLATSIKSLLGVNSPEVEITSTSCSELADVVAQEKALLQEFSELFELVSALEEEERGLKCCLIFMKVHHQKESAS